MTCCEPIIWYSPRVEYKAFSEEITKNLHGLLPRSMYVKIASPITEGKLQVGLRPCLPTGQLSSTGQRQMQDPPSDGLPTGHMNPKGTLLNEPKSCKKRMGDDSASSSAPIKQTCTFEIHDHPHGSISILARVVNSTESPRQILHIPILAAIVLESGVIDVSKN